MSSPFVKTKKKPNKPVVTELEIENLQKEKAQLQHTVETQQFNTADVEKFLTEKNSLEEMLGSLTTQKEAMEKER